MSFASCSTRFESSPARTSEAGAHVDKARTTTSSPDATRSTGSPAASYHPHATVLGVGISVYVLPGAGAGHDALDTCAVDADKPVFGVADTEDGVRQPIAANTPMESTDLKIARFVIALTPSVAVRLRSIQLVAQRPHADAQQVRRASPVAVRHFERAFDELCLGAIDV